jgi:hypothetical protein
MNKIGTLFLMLTLVAVLGLTEKAPVDLPARIKELNSYWAEVSRCVREGDFAGYKAKQIHFSIASPMNSRYYKNNKK